MPRVSKIGKGQCFSLVVKKPSANILLSYWFSVFSRRSNLERKEQVRKTIIFYVKTRESNSTDSELIDLRSTLRSCPSFLPQCSGLRVYGVRHCQALSVDVHCTRSTNERRFKPCKNPIYIFISSKHASAQFINQ